MPSLIQFEKQILKDLPAGAVLAGVDEAGRGPLAGPVVVAAVVITDLEHFDLDVNDSKQLSEEKREELAKFLLTSPYVEYSICLRDASQIDRLNILRATHEGMREAVQKLPRQPNLTLVDGLPVPDFPTPARFIVKGDATSASIAAASILAKTRHDAILRELDRQYPQYGFAVNKGYGTADHLAALKKFGPCPAHRLTFAPIRDLHQPELF